MNKIKQQFENNKKSFVGYLTIGVNGIHQSLEEVNALIDGGVNILELGVPFSDPVADGPTIQAASQKALENNTTLYDVLNLAKQITKPCAKILFSYYNPILAAGNDIYQKIKFANIDGILIVDLPLEEAQAHLTLCQLNQIEPIFLISPSTPLSRIKQYEHYSNSMLYYVCRNGTTGIKDRLPDDFESKIQAIKSTTKLPVVVGFGISNKTMAAKTLEYADGFVIGSTFVKATMQGENLTAMAKSLDPREDI